MTNFHVDSSPIAECLRLCVDSITFVLHMQELRFLRYYRTNSCTSALNTITTCVRVQVRGCTYEDGAMFDTCVSSRRFARARSQEAATAQSRVQARMRFIYQIQMPGVRARRARFNFHIHLHELCCNVCCVLGYFVAAAYAGTLVFRLHVAHTAFRKETIVFLHVSAQAHATSSSRLQCQHSRSRYRRTARHTDPGRLARDCVGE